MELELSVLRYSIFAPPEQARACIMCLDPRKKRQSIPYAVDHDGQFKHSVSQATISVVPCPGGQLAC